MVAFTDCICSLPNGENELESIPNVPFKT